MEDYKVNFLEKWQSNEQYFDMLVLLSSLSNLFSDNSVPYLDYRVAENLFCKYFNAINDARSCTAYDARLGTLGIGIKTFGIKKTSTEKIAEFDRFKGIMDKYGLFAKRSRFDVLYKQTDEEKDTFGGDCRCRNGYADGGKGTDLCQAERIVRRCGRHQPSARICGRSPLVGVD